ncbi:MAG: DUF4350 domain-containing protein [Acidimicrobiales bacterium]
MAALLVVIVVALLASGGDSRRSGPALSPRSDLPEGTSALLALLAELGAAPRVVAAAPAGTDQSALLLRDDLSSAQRADLERWVERGGDLVVADPSSALAGRAGATLRAVGSINRGDCDVSGIDGVATIHTDRGIDGLALNTPVRYLRVEGSSSCFDGYLMRRSRGEGTITSIGGAEPFVNALLATGDGSTLAVDLLAPSDTEHVAIIDVVPAAGAGSASLLSLIAPRLEQAFAIAVVAFVVFAVHRGRRLGRPVTEHQLIAIPGSGLVAAVGRLQQRTRSADRAGAALRDDARRAIASQLGLPASAPPETIANSVATRTGLDAARVRSAITDGPVPDERWLVALSTELDAIRQEVNHARR